MHFNLHSELILCTLINRNLVLKIIMMIEITVEMYQDNIIFACVSKNKYVFVNFRKYLQGKGLH